MELRRILIKLPSARKGSARNPIIDPAIKVRKNSSIKSMGCYTRKIGALKQISDPGNRWAAETAFSSMKRIFGEHVISIKWKNIVNELLMKAYIYNMFMKISQ